MNERAVRFLWALVSVLAVATAGESAAAKDNSASGQSQLVVHEWGTFTSLQDDQGRQLAGINVDDEPVPSFVYGYKSRTVYPQYAVAPRILSQGAPIRHPSVTLRLETPVVYFYPPASQTTPLVLDVHVKFRGGWLSQYYPFAARDPNPPSELFLDRPSALTSETETGLKWTNLVVGAPGKVRETDDPVWITPREVHAATVTVPEGDSEKYLFYRGVGHLDSPLSVETDLERGTLALRPRFEQVLRPRQLETINWLWLVHIRADGKTAFRRLDQFRVTSDPNQVAVAVKSSFDPGDFSRAKLEELKQDMHLALTSEGLFDDEATVMLATWQKSYFASGGLRLFYLVPRAWTEQFLPLSLSRPAEVTRVLMARTELISPEQRELLRQLAATEHGDTAWLAKVRESPHAQKFFEGRSEFGDLGVAIPADYALYLALGRFRNALVVHEQARTQSPALARFIASYELGNPSNGQ